MLDMFGKISLGFVAAMIVAAPATAQDRSKISTRSAELTHRAPEHIAADPANHLTFELSNGGTVEFQLRPDAAPLHVYRIQTLAAQGFYDGLTFHRVIPGFMAQGGDPMGTGEGGSDLPDVPAEFNRLPHLRGALAMARAQDENSANSQFYIVLSPSFNLDGDYTVLGRVTSGMQAVDQIAPGEPPLEPTKIVSARLGGPVPPAPMVAAPEAQPAS